MTIEEMAGRRVLAAELEYAARGLGWFALRPFPGYTGRPHLASAEAGARLATLLVDGFAEAAEAVLFRGAPPPAPVMPWLEGLSLGGRLAPGALPVRR